MTPFRLAYLTSCRWVDTHEGGILGLLLRLLGEDGEPARTFRLVAVVCDDDDEQYARAVAAGRVWSPDTPLPDGSGRTLGEVTHRVPSQWWKDLRPGAGETEAAFRVRRAAAKAAYERDVLAVLAGCGADLVLVDSYLTIVGDVLLAAYGGRMLNVHPAVTEPGDPARLPGRTPTRDTYTRAAHGVVIVDDKRGALPAGERVTVVCDGVPREAVRVPPLRTGAVTVHVVTPDVDAGPVVRCERYELGDDELSFAAIRARNHEVKRRVVPAALLAHVAAPATLALIARGRAGGPWDVRSATAPTGPGAADRAAPVRSRARTGGR